MHSAKLSAPFYPDHVVLLRLTYFIFNEVSESDWQPNYHIKWMLSWFIARLRFGQYPKISPYWCLSISVVLWLPTAPSLPPLPSSSLQDSNQDGEEAGQEEDDDDDDDCDGGQQCWDATMKACCSHSLLPLPAPPAACRPFLLSTHPHVHTLLHKETHIVYIEHRKCVTSAGF